MTLRTPLALFCLFMCLAASTSAWATPPLYASYESRIEGAPGCLAFEATPGSINSSENARFESIRATNTCLNKTVTFQQLEDNASIQSFDAQDDEHSIDVLLGDLPVATPTELEWTLESGGDGAPATVEEGTMTLTIECVADCGRGEDKGNVGCFSRGERGATDMQLSMLIVCIGGVGMRRRKRKKTDLG